MIFSQFRGGVHLFTLVVTVVVDGTEFVLPGPEDELILTLCGVFPEGTTAVLEGELTEDAVGEDPERALGPLS